MAVEAVAEKGQAVRRLPQEPWEKGIGPGIVDKKIMGSKDSNFMLMGIAKMDHRRALREAHRQD